MVKEKKLKKIRSKRFLAKPKVDLVKGLDAVKAAIAAGEGKVGLVREGPTGHFDREMVKEIKWLHK